jgi:hypothetical protein
MAVSWMADSSASGLTPEERAAEIRWQEWFDRSRYPNRCTLCNAAAPIDYFIDLICPSNEGIQTTKSMFFCGPMHKKYYEDRPSIWLQYTQRCAACTKPCRPWPGVDDFCNADCRDFYMKLRNAPPAAAGGSKSTTSFKPAAAAAAAAAAASDGDDDADFAWLLDELPLLETD